MIQGEYGLRFSGFSRKDNGDVFYLVGVGRLRFDGQGNVTGEHTSSSTALQNEVEQKTAEYDLTGTYKFDERGRCTAEIQFDHRTIGDDSADMTGWFRLVGIGNYSRLWIISTRAVNWIPMTLDEVISGEAVRC